MEEKESIQDVAQVGSENTTRAVTNAKLLQRIIHLVCIKWEIDFLSHSL